MQIAFVTPRFPFPTTKGDKLRAYHEIRRLSRRHAITLVAGADEPVDEAALDALRPYCERIVVVPVGGWRSIVPIVANGLTARLPLQALFYDTKSMRRAVRDTLASKSFDVIHASTIRVAPHVWDVSGAPVVIDLVDTVSRGLALRRETVGAPLRLAYDWERRRLRDYELAACRRFSRLIVCAEADRAALGSENVVVIRTCADLDQFSFVREGRADDLVVMTGNMGYPPNVDAAVWFSRHVWPLVRAAHPAARFQIVGTRPAAAVRALGAQPGIEVVGAVPEIAPYLQRASLAISPMRGGSGMQTKALESMATGTPLVITSFANEGVGAIAGRHALIADQPGAFGRAVLDLLGRPELRESLAEAAHEYVSREFSWDRHVERLEEVYAEAISQPGAGPAGLEPRSSGAREPSLGLGDLGI